MFEVELIKKDFPILSRKINDNDLVYLDNAATSQKPNVVIDSLVDYYKFHNANVHRGIHTLSEEATKMYEEARETVKDYLGAETSRQIIFTKGATESLNFVASTLGEKIVEDGDIILTTHIEHHSNLVPWQELARKKNAKLEFIENFDDGELDFSDLQNKLSDNSHKGKVKIVAVTHASNVLGTIFDVKKISKLVHDAGAYLIVDGAQAAPHLRVNMQSLDCDAYAVSAHKMLGPTGIGALYLKKEVIETIDPYQFGGGMIDNVELLTSTWAEIPEKFEAGTPNVEGAVGFSTAIKYLQQIGIDNIKQHEEELNKYAFDKLSSIPDISIYGPQDPTKRTGLISFTIKNMHPHDIAAVLNSNGIAVRSGHHCAHPLHKKLNITATVRASYYLYNSKKDIDKLAEGISKAKKILGK